IAPVQPPTAPITPTPPQPPQPPQPTPMPPYPDPERPTGEGTASSPFQIADFAELDWVRIQMITDFSYRSKYYQLNSNIQLYPDWQGFRAPFNGNFNGNGHHISGWNSDFGGLFSIVEGTIENLTVYGNVNVDTASTASRGGFADYLRGGTLENVGFIGNVTNYGGTAGGLVGELSENGTIRNASVDGNIRAFNVAGGIVGRATSSHVALGNFYGTVYSENDVAGGIVGHLTQDSQITASAANATITSANNGAGGIVGWMVGSRVMRTASEGNIHGVSAGGIVGQTAASEVTLQITDSYSTANVTGSWGAGGIVGTLQTPNAQVRRVYATGEIRGTSNAGAILGVVSGSHDNTADVLRSAAAANTFIQGNNTIVGQNDSNLVNPSTAGTGALEAWFMRNDLPQPQNLMQVSDAANEVNNSLTTGFNSRTFWENSEMIVVPGLPPLAWGMYLDFDNVWVWNNETNILPTLQGLTSQPNPVFNPNVTAYGFTEFNETPIFAEFPNFPNDNDYIEEEPENTDNITNNDKKESDEEEEIEVEEENDNTDEDSDQTDEIEENEETENSEEIYETDGSAETDENAEITEPSDSEDSENTEDFEDSEDFEISEETNESNENVNSELEEQFEIEKIEEIEEIENARLANLYFRLTLEENQA
ncbi:MAG: MSCRAMM family adhesin SdrC, partial [Firmicutes bacterium]|nr:MSCRAMM family adhesin SdrC [Bacillota bacterium]